MQNFATEAVGYASAVILTAAANPPYAAALFDTAYPHIALAPYPSRKLPQHRLQLLDALIA
jgi:hypothetical protein